MPIRVLIVDDSALMRQMLSEILSSDPAIEVVGVAADPLIARQRIKALSPDVLTLDIEMPVMDGLSFLEKLMSLHPMPVVVVSTLTQKGTDAAVRALELGAIDCVGKPLADIRSGIAELAATLITKVKAAAIARPRARSTAARSQKPLTVDPNLSTAGRIVAIGASTGGVEALQQLLVRLPAGAPAILITQHMPAGFTSSFARRLDSQCAVTVVEATDGRRVLPSHVYIAPGALHLELVRTGAHYGCRLHDGPPVSGHRPSVDVLFRSVSLCAPPGAVGIILTGMGRDGADGLLAMRKAGARTYGQSEASCLIYGMPKAAMMAGSVEHEMPLDRLAEEIIALRRATC